jgi:NADP-dependent 3-hydroxy acid dehydrogenase YdfG
VYQSCPTNRTDRKRLEKPAEAIRYAIGQPDEVDVNEMLIRPMAQEFQPSP